MQSLSYTSSQHTEYTQNIEKNLNNTEFSNIARNYELPNCEEIVNRILHQEKILWEEERNFEQRLLPDVFFGALELDKERWDNKRKTYLIIETWVRKNGNKIPSWMVAGPLHYGMTLNEMEFAITNKFKEMALSGNLLTEKSLNKRHNRESFYPNHKNSNNLTRIWGAEFLNSQLVNNKTLKAAKHFLVVDDNASEIEVKVVYGEYPYLSLVNNAYILSQKIEGNRKAAEFQFSTELYSLRYRDFKDPGNILCDSEGSAWIVDTELKSFDSPELSDKLALVQNYLKKRFVNLVGKENSLSQIFKISVADLNL